MNKGIVMDIQKHSVVVLTPDGEFITFKRKSHPYMIGQEVSFNEQEQRVPRFSIPSFLKPASLLVACFLCVFLFFYNQPEEKALAYVSVDINPSLEASVTKDLHVIELRACNDDGKRILKELKRWKNQPLQDVVRAIVKQSQEDGYLTNDKQVMLTSVAKDKSLEPQLQKAMQALKREYDKKHVTVVYQESTMQMREKAQKAGVSTGVYIKQENEKKNSLVPPAPPSNQEEHPPEIHSQPESSPDSSSNSPSNSSSNSSSVKEERHEGQEQKEQRQKEQKQFQQQQAQQSNRNNGHQEENNDKEQKKEYKEQKKGDKEQQKEQKDYEKEQKKEQKNYEKEQKKEEKGHKQEDKGHGKGDE
ncbi:anti-sigma factor domain-containing protein [Bacillus sp. CGMCC 1.60114]|uniref:anti-sigma factor domain-containing protein n=1 Tax=Bacillus sp. CGMCC 1.60114 TaxID=3351841 RepID=UPI003628500A